jgi:aldehyde:ferredoxin oxidoreductase
LIAAIADLDRGNVEYRAVDDEIAEKFVGGRGINTKLLFDLTGANMDPLSPSSPVIFGTGPLTGTPFPMGGRFLATAKSPLTGTIFTSACGGRMGVYLKKNGIDFLILRGAAAQSSYVLIENGGISIMGAGKIWGKPKAYVKEHLRVKHGRDISILLIGKAGETGVSFANIENDGRYLGRGGLGSVLGAKRVKAIAVRPKGRVPIPDRETFSFMAYECRKWLSANPITSKGLPEFGTGILLNYMRESGLLSAHNFRLPAPFESASVSGEAVTDTILKKKRACPFCPVACGRVTTEGDGPEYETLWSLGVNLRVHDVKKVAKLNSLCNELGLDTISTGSVIGMAIELAESGKLKSPAGYGDFEGISSLITSLAEKDGEGSLLSLGARKLGEMFDSPDIAAHAKGLELPAYDPRGAYGNALGYATSNRGGCHMQGYLIGAEVLGVPKLVDRFSRQGKASLLALYQNISTFMDTLVMCRFASLAIPHDYYARIATVAAGRGISWEDSIAIGERIWNLERLFNLREGVEEDKLPGRFAEVPIKDLLAEYYAVRGWDETGIPRQEKLNKLGLP